MGHAGRNVKRARKNEGSGFGVQDGAISDQSSVISNDGAKLDNSAPLVLVVVLDILRFAAIAPVMARHESKRAEQDRGVSDQDGRSGFVDASTRRTSRGA